MVKQNGIRQNFDREKLRVSMSKACEKRPVSMEALDLAVDSILAEIDVEGLREVQTKWLGAKVMQKLEAIDHVAYVRYASVYRQFEDVGEFIDEINSLGSRVPRVPTQPEFFKKV